MDLSNDSFLKLSNSIYNTHIQEWQRANKKVIGFYCAYMPEELFHAADLLLFRIRATGSKTEDLADTYMVRFTCSFVRMTLDLALRGGYDFLNGLFVCNSCDHSRRMFEIFDMKIFSRKEFKEKPPRFYIPMPHVLTNEGFEWYKTELDRIKGEVEKNFKVKITTEKLKAAIQIYNENRRLLREIASLRSLDKPKLSESDFLQISMANTSVPKHVANKELERILNAVKNLEGSNKVSKRIMLVGSIVDNIDFMRLIEESGAHIVADSVCFGTRNILDDIDLKGDLCENLAKRLYYRMSCPRMMDDHAHRFDYLKSELKRTKVDGVILQRINNCDLHGCDNMLYEHELKDMDIPVLNIDRESFQADTTRLQTRIEAFLEMINK